MNSENSSKTGLGNLVGSVSQTIQEKDAVEKVTSNEMFKNSIMSFMEREMGNMDVIEVAQNQVNLKLLDQMEEENMDVGEMMRFSELLSKQKTSRIHALFDILKPTKDSANPLLNNEKDSSLETSQSNLSTQELQTLLKFMQVMQSSKEED